MPAIQSAAGPSLPGGDRHQPHPPCTPSQAPQPHTNVASRAPPPPPPPPTEATPNHPRADMRHSRRQHSPEDSGPQPPAPPPPRWCGTLLNRGHSPGSRWGARSETANPKTHPRDTAAQIRHPRGPTPPASKPTTPDVDPPGQEQPAAPPHTPTQHDPGGAPAWTRPHNSPFPPPENYTSLPLRSPK
ncbi:basic proline-rich protein-like [Gouania willdenowi]|uniref:basic proline-rich protein-like n=1 Tax=Gouania willdenowi TaxID=441366 RepID=UPI001056C4DF|nr:basic proline-rich protein-like [Gouania willdenowi]